MKMKFEICFCLYFAFFSKQTSPAKHKKRYLLFFFVCRKIRTFIFIFSSPFLESVCVRVRVCVRLRVCVRVCVFVRERLRETVYVWMWVNVFECVRECVCEIECVCVLLPGSECERGKIACFRCATGFIDNIDGELRRETPLWKKTAKCARTKGHKCVCVCERKSVRVRVKQVCEFVCVWEREREREVEEWERRKQFQTQNSVA